MDISKFAVAADKKDGVWLQFEDASFLIAYAHRPQFTRTSVRVKKRFPDQKIKQDPMLAQRMVIEIMAECVLLDWKNVRERGKLLPCTIENRIKLLEIEPFREWVASESRELFNFQAEAEAEDAAALKSVGGVDTEVGEG